MIYDMKADCSDVCFIVRISLSHTLIFFTGVLVQRSKYVQSKKLMAS